MTGAAGERPAPPAGVEATTEVSTVADDEVVLHRGHEVSRHEGLEPSTDYDFDGIGVRTLARPEGELLCRFATVNDVHFGETECGIVEGLDVGPVFSSPPGTDPYPQVMNRAAVGEIAAIDPAVVIVKGDLTSRGTAAEYAEFLACYEPAFGERLCHVRGNHDAYYGETFAAFDHQSVSLPGITLAVIDTSVPAHFAGRVTDSSLEWLEQIASDNPATPILTFGHHHPWSPDSSQRPDNYFGINPDDSEKLIAAFARHPNLRGYFAGHTHRNRLRRFSGTGEVPWVEVACVKDYPGAWAEYRVYETGVLQVHRRISTPGALEWTEKTRNMFAGTYAAYALGRLEHRCFRVDTR